MATAAAEANSGNGGPTNAMGDNMRSPPTIKNPIAPNMQAIDSSSANNPLESLTMRADPDAQATVTDFLDFTEYLPADMMRSLTLIGKLDQTYTDASTMVDRLTGEWGRLPTLPGDQRPAPAQLRAAISDNLNQAMSSRVSSYAEALRMNEYVIRYVNRAKTILGKLQTMRDNYPTEEQKSPVQNKSPQMSRAPKIVIRPEKDGQKVRRPPRITVPGEVLAPYDIDFNAYSSSTEESSEDEMDISSPRRTTPAPRIKLNVKKTPKVPKQKIPKAPRVPRQSGAGSGSSATPMISTSSALAQLKPPPENAEIGTDDAPWLRLTPYELAKLRKRMKKNAVWSPSDTMIQRELKSLGRGPEALNMARKKAEEEGRPFNPKLPEDIIDAESGTQHPPEGAISAKALGAEEVQLSNRGMKLNEAKKLKREALAKQAVEDAAESDRKMAVYRRMFLTATVGGSVQDGSEKAPETSQPHGQSQTKAPSKSKAKKRKRDSMSEGGPETVPEVTENANPNPPSKPQVKRTKTETPVPPPQLTARPMSVPPPVETPVPPPQVGQVGMVAITSNTPVPLPIHPSSASESSAIPTRQTASPASGTSPVPPLVIATAVASLSTAASTATSTLSSSSTSAIASAGAGANTAATSTIVPTKPPAETPAPTRKTSTTPIPPPTTRDLGKRETRKDTKSLQPIATNTKQSTSHPNTPVTTPATDGPSANTRRPVSRGKTGSQEPPASLAMERPRRASTARNTPVPETRQPSKRTKRPAPGVVATNSGGKSAVGKRKAAPRKRVRGATKKGGVPNQQVEQEVEVEVDDDGNVIDPDEPRYCLCNRVSFGTMIQCDNVDVSRTEDTYMHTTNMHTKGMNASNKKLTHHNPQACKQEWFHLECVDLSEIPPRTTKWYCPECRVALNIGERGEVTSRGVKM